MSPTVVLQSSYNLPTGVLTVAEAARQLDVSTGTLRMQLQRGVPHVVRLDHRRIGITVEEAERYRRECLGRPRV